MKLSSPPASLSASSSANLCDVLPILNDSERTLETIVLESVATEQPKQVKAKGWAVFASTFVTIFLAEIGDKTQLTTLLMTAQSHAPGIVFAGAASALVTTSLLGVLLGQWLSTRIAPKTLEKSAGVSLLLISAMLLWDVLRSYQVH